MNIRKAIYLSAIVAIALSSTAFSETIEGPSLFEHEYPKDGDVFKGDADKSITFKWTAKNGAEGYLLSIYSANTKKELFKQYVQGTEYQVNDKVLRYNKAYYWSVQSCKNCEDKAEQLSKLPKFYKEMPIFKFEKKVSGGYNTIIKKGWNAIAFPINPEISAADIKESCDVSTFYAYSGDKWQFPPKTAIMQGYLIYSFEDKDCTIYLDTALNDPPSKIELKEGWNLIGGMGAKLSDFTQCNGINGALTLGDNSAYSSVDLNTNLDVHKSYWIYTKNACTLDKNTNKNLPLPPGYTTSAGPCENKGIYSCEENEKISYYCENDGKKYSRACDYGCDSNTKKCLPAPVDYDKNEKGCNYGSYGDKNILCFKDKSWICDIDTQWYVKTCNAGCDTKTGMCTELPENIPKCVKYSARYGTKSTTSDENPNVAEICFDNPDANGKYSGGMVDKYIDPKGDGGSQIEETYCNAMGYCSTTIKSCGGGTERENIVLKNTPYAKSLTFRNLKSTEPQMASKCG